MKIKYLKFVAILIFSFSTYSQVTVSVQDLQYTNNGQPAIYPTNCGNIDLASSTSTSISFGINLSKPNGQVVGLSDLRVYTQKSSSDSRIERSWTQIQESFWSTSVPNTYLTTASFSINSSDFNATGGTLFVVFKSSGNVEYQTACSFTITKTPPPTFTLSPTTLSIPCGSVAPVTFSYSNVYSTPGVTYNYSYSGWTFVSQTSNSITLKPANANILPSNFSLVPIVNGVTQPYKVCTVTRAPFTDNSINIIGNSSLCSTGQYTYNIVNPNNYNVSWSIPQSNVANIVSVTNNQVVVNVLQSNAVLTLNATVNNACNQSIIKSLDCFVGAPVLSFSNSSQSSSVTFCKSETQREDNSITINYPVSSNITNFEWFTGNFVGEPIQNCNLPIISSFNNKAYFKASDLCSGTVRVRAKNQCGWGEWYLIDVNIIDCKIKIGPGYGDIYEFKTSDTILEIKKNITIYPNPSNNIVNIEIRDKSNQLLKNTPVTGELFDLMGYSKAKVEIINNKATFSVQGLNKGIYVLKIYINGQVESHQIAVE